MMISLAMRMPGPNRVTKLIIVLFASFTFIHLITSLLGNFHIIKRQSQTKFFTVDDTGLHFDFFSFLH